MKKVKKQLKKQLIGYSLSSSSLNNLEEIYREKINETYFKTIY
ncbi:hypothetical protein M2263_002665 [Providencia alcalifaciens]|nr:hypothetical protein [Providencia alcalifaciens]